MTMRVGTPGFIAPEVYCSGEATAESDGWSVAAIIHQTIMGEPPIQPMTVDAEIDFTELYAKAEGNDLLHSLVEVAQEMSRADPTKRIKVPAAKAKFDEMASKLAASSDEN